MKQSFLKFVSVEELTGQVSRNFQTTIQYQFDCLARKVMIRTQSNFYRSICRKINKECSLSGILENEFELLQTIDTYHLDGEYYSLLTLCLEVVNEAIAKALDSLPEQKRNIILMFYFLEMSDADIALELKKDRSTIYRSRISSLAVLKKRLEDENCEKTKKAFTISHN